MTPVYKNRNLKLEISKISDEIKGLSEKRQFLFDDIGRLMSRKSILQKRLVKKVVVTDHARVRYLERMLGWDWKEVDLAIEAEESHHNKYSEGRITTVIPKTNEGVGNE